MGYRQGAAAAADSLVMGTVGKRKETHSPIKVSKSTGKLYGAIFVSEFDLRKSRKPAPACSTIPKLALELKQIIHCASQPKLPQITPCKMAMPLGQMTKGASLEELLESCIHSFDSEGNLCRSGQLLQITVTMHRFLLSSTDLMLRLSTLYEEASEKKLSTRCLKICYFVRYWMTEFWLMFKVDGSLRETMEKFREVVNAYDEKLSRHLLDTSQITSRDFPWKLTQRIKSHTSKKRKVSLLFDHLEPQELAEHLTYLEFKSFRRISFSDYQNYIVNSCVKDNPTMERSVALCNGVSQWVQLMVLSRPTPQLRAEVLIKFIHVAQKLHHLQNFNTLMAVIGGLCHSSISRLKETSGHVPHEVSKVLNEMTELLSSCRNYDNYRRAYSECTGFKIPIVGVHLKDLISLHEAMPNYLEGRKINVPKLHSLYNHINELVQLQQVAPPLEANKDLVHLLTLSLDLYYTEDEIYELSYAREPRNHRIPPLTPSKPPVVADWASGVAPKPDPKTISKHVQRMVDSVFKNYDHDQDGYISQDEFEKIAASFPFSFCVMDKDREGLISREEITAYFMRASSIYSKLGLGFPHNFQETTYLRPTFCDNCAGFLWGVIKQGYRCRDCGMNCHKQCKELVVFECKKRSNSSSSAENSPNSGITAAVLCPAGMKGLMNGSDEALFTFPSREGTELAELPEEIKDRTIMLVGSSAPKIALRIKNLASDKSTQTDHGMSGCDGLARHYAIHHRKAYAKWDNKNSTRNARNQDGVSTPDNQELEQERDALRTQNETLKLQLQDAQKRIEDLQMELKSQPSDSTDHNSCS